MTNPYEIKGHLVQTSQNFSTWVDRTEVRCDQCSEGAGQVIGEATLVREFGQVAYPGQDFGAVLAVDWIGWFIRILIESDAGTVFLNDKQYEALWHGVVIGTSINDTGGGTGVQTIHCNGLAGVLEQMTIGRGAEQRVGAAGISPSQVFDPGYMPAFNRAKRGRDMSTAGEIVANDGGYIYANVHQRSSGLGSAWTAGEMLDHILKICAHGEFAPVYARQGALRWTFSDPEDCLDYLVNDVDVFAGSILNAINTIINPRRGLLWRLTVSGTTATINVTSTSPAPISGTSYTLPAASVTHEPDLTGGAADGIAGVDLSEDSSQTFDVIEIIGAQPWVGMTVAYEATPTEATALGKGWKTKAETDWDNGQVTPENEKVWRRFTLRPEWIGQQFGQPTIGLRNKLEFDGVGATDGTREYDKDNAATWQPETMECTRTMPCGVGFVVDTLKGYQDPLSFIGPDGDAIDLNGLDPEIGAWSSTGITIEDLPGAVVLGHNAEDANEFASAGEEDQPIVVTVGIRESAPLLVRWVRPVISWPRAVPRVLTVRAPQYEEWLILPYTVIGVDDNGNYTTTGASEINVRSDVASMNDTLALLRTWYSEPARTLRYVKRGVIDTSSASAPGVLVTTATLGIGSKTINAPYVRRVWDLTPEGFGTAWDTSRMIPDIEAIR